MVLFLPFQQEFNCINRAGAILGKIIYNASSELYVFYLDDQQLEITKIEENMINRKLKALNEGVEAVPAQDDD